VIDSVIYHKSEYRERRQPLRLLRLLRAPSRALTHNATPLGHYRGWDAPEAVERGESFNSVAHGWAPIGSHHVRLSLAPNRRARFIFVARVLGECPGREVRPARVPDINKVRVQPVIDRWTEPANVERALVELGDNWDGYLSVLEVTTPDEDTNRMVNI